MAGVNLVNGITILPSFYYMVSMNVFKLEFYTCLFLSFYQYNATKVNLNVTTINVFHKQIDVMGCLSVMTDQMNLDVVSRTLHD